MYFVSYLPNDPVSAVWPDKRPSRGNGIFKEKNMAKRQANKKVTSTPADTQGPRADPSVVLFVIICFIMLVALAVTR
jgi:hypothetical protein